MGKLKKIFKKVLDPAGIFKKDKTPSVAAFEEEEETVPTYEEEGEPVAKSVRDAEVAKLKRRRGAAGTILTSPLGTTTKSSGLLG